MAAPNDSNTFAEFALSLVEYSPESGAFTWKRKPSKFSPIEIGSEAGGISSNGYRVIRIGKGRIQAHRLAWFAVHRDLPTEQIDHINRDRLDNRITNLRLASNQENQQNANRRGYYYHSAWGKFVAQIMVGGRSIYLGGFNEESQARAAYLSAKSSLHPRWSGENSEGCGPRATEKPRTTTGLKIR